MFERFTDTARRVVVSAQTEARNLMHDRIGTEHILLGLFDPDSGIAARALSQLGLTAEMARTDIIELIGMGTDAPSGHIPFTPRAKKVLELALREALQLSHNYIGTEHILLALEREGEGVAARILVEHVPDVRNVRRTVMALLDDQPGGTPKPRANRTSAADEVVAAAEALAGDAPMGSHHLLEALIRSEGSMAATVLSQLGISPDAIAEKVDELDTDETTDATPQETAARKMEIRVEGDEVHLVFRDESTLDLARTVSGITGEGPIRPAGPLAGQFVPLWTQLNELLRKLARTPEEDPKGTGKAALLVRRVLHDRLRRRRPPGQSPGQAAES